MPERCTELDTQDRTCLLPVGHSGQHGFYGKRPEMEPTTHAKPGDAWMLERWWQKTDTADWEAFKPKLSEYGARDLVAHGRAIAAMGGYDTADHEEAWYGEIGCSFYLHGKLARAMEAYVHGNLPSPDTLKDIETYARMARAFRERGGLA